MTGIGAVTDSNNNSQNVIQENTIGKDDFFKMLLAQIQNQNPLNPIDGADFAAQLAQFSSLERLGNINDQLETMNLYQASVNNAQSLNLIGREVTAKGDVLKVEGEPVDLTYNLSGYAKKVSIKIYDEEGSLVDTLEFGNQKEGRNSVVWDCNNVSKGNYTFDVSAVNDNGDNVDVDTMTTGVVAGVTFKNGSSYLSINGQDIAFGDVISVNGLEG
ncbi:MAG: flagellar hook assembly protein FlgD [Deltaproteobacteria bacterium]|nr:flagellar hook assembly protein FlgD [Deltaproteobacteria bacterium]